MQTLNTESNFEMVIVYNLHLDTFAVLKRMFVAVSDPDLIISSTINSASSP